MKKRSPSLSRIYTWLGGGGTLEITYRYVIGGERVNIFDMLLFKKVLVQDIVGHILNIVLEMVES